MEIAPLGHELTIDMQLPIDENNYYHLTLGHNWQTLHRITGHVSSTVNEFELAKVSWMSSHYWILGDTIGYIVHNNNTLNDTIFTEHWPNGTSTISYGTGYLYMNNDTSYVVTPLDYDVPTINESSYSTMDGEINTMFAPVLTMKGDTITVTVVAKFADGWMSDIKTLNIVIE
jgi:hypothetical protein